MKFKSLLVSSLSGKLGGLVGSTAKGVNYLRRLAVGVNPNTVQQQAVRNAVKTLTQRWSVTLTDDQRNAWGLYAQSVPVTKRGDTMNLSGFNWYIALNVPKVQAGLTVVDDAPVVYDIGAPVGLNGTFTGALGAGTLSLTMPAGSGNAGDRFLVYGSRPFAAGRARPAGGNQFIGTMTANGVATAKTLTLPFSIGGGTNQMVLTVRLSRSDGRLSGPFQFPL